MELLSFRNHFHKVQDFLFLKWVSLSVVIAHFDDGDMVSAHNLTHATGKKVGAFVSDPVFQFDSLVLGDTDSLSKLASFDIQGKDSNRKALGQDCVG